MCPLYFISWLYIDWKQNFFQSWRKDLTQKVMMFSYLHVDFSAWTITDFSQTCSGRKFIRDETDLHLLGIHHLHEVAQCGVTNKYSSQIWISYYCIIKGSIILLIQCCIHLSFLPLTFPIDMLGHHGQQQSMRVYLGWCSQQLHTRLNADHECCLQACQEEQSEEHLESCGKWGTNGICSRTWHTSHIDSIQTWASFQICKALLSE